MNFLKTKYLLLNGFTGNSVKLELSIKYERVSSAQHNEWQWNYSRQECKRVNYSMFTGYPFLHVCSTCPRSELLHINQQSNNTQWPEWWHSGGNGNEGSAITVNTKTMKNVFLLFRIEFKMEIWIVLLAVGDSWSTDTAIGGTRTT